MSLAPITLPTDKSTAVIDNTHRTLRQDESGLSITVNVLNEDNTAYNLTGKNLVFCENKQNNKIIIDNGQGDNCGTFNRNPDNDTKGIFNYVLQENVYAASGKAWFEINDGTTVDSTKNFYFDVDTDATISARDNDYIGSLKALETAMAGAQSKVTSDLADMENQIAQNTANTKAANEAEIAQAVKNLTDQTNAALSNVNEYTQKLATLQSQWDSELQSIQTKADTDTTNAVNAINQKYTDDFNNLKNDFDSWKTETTNNYTTQINDLIATAKQNGIDVNDLKNEITNLQQSLNNIDFTKFVKPSDLNNYPTKQDLANAIAGAGDVKTINETAPDGNGNIQVPVYARNLLPGTQSKLKTINMGQWSGGADVYPITDLNAVLGKTITARIKISSASKDTMLVLEFDQNYYSGNVIKAGQTGYSTITYTMPSKVGYCLIRPSWTNATDTGTISYGEAKLAVWSDPNTPPDMTWLPNEADAALNWDNLLSGTNVPITFVGNNTVNQTCRTDSLTKDIPAGSTLSFSCDINASDNCTLSIMVTDAWESVSHDNGQFSYTLTKGNNHLVGLLNNGSTGKVYPAGTQISFKLDNQTATLTITHRKLEYGPVSTPWCLAPIDVADSATKADKTALNDLSTEVNTNVKNDIDSINNKLSQYVFDCNNNLIHNTTIDCNDYLHETRTIKVTNAQFNNGPVANTQHLWGWLITYYYDTNSVVQKYQDGTTGVTFWRRTNEAHTYAWAWHQYANQDTVDQLNNRITTLENKRPILASSQDDAVNKSKNSNDEYYW